MTKAQRKARAKRAGAVRRKANAVKAFMKKMNPGKPAPAAVRVKRLKGGGISVMPLKMMNPSAFDRCVADVRRKGTAYDPRAVCATAGRQKYGQAEMTRRAMAGKRRKRRGNVPRGSLKTWDVRRGGPGGYIGTVTAASKTEALRKAKEYYRLPPYERGAPGTAISVRLSKQ